MAKGRASVDSRAGLSRASSGRCVGYRRRKEGRKALSARASRRTQACLVKSLFQPTRAA